MHSGNPFSALYYIRENKKKMGVIIVMFLLSTLLFLVGNYLDSDFYDFYRNCEYTDKTIIVNSKNMGLDEDYKNFKDIIEKDDKLEYVEFSSRISGHVKYKSILGLDEHCPLYAFNSKEDMIKVLDRLGIDGDFSDCKSGSIVMTKKTANGTGFKKGDIIDKDYDKSFKEEYSLDAIVEADCNISFLIREEKPLSNLIVYSNTLEGKELYDYVKDKANGLEVIVNKTERDEYSPSFNSQYLIFYTAMIMVAIVLAVTVNTVTTGHYMKRVYEFAVYKALGRTKGQIKRKITKEILLTNLIAVTMGALIILVFSYLMNELYYYNHGLKLEYFTGLGVRGFLICNLLIIVPVILSKQRLMVKADVTDY